MATAITLLPDKFVRARFTRTKSLHAAVAHPGIKPGLRPRGEEGSFTFAVLMWLLIAFALMTLVVDGSMRISETEQAANVADAVARNVANDLNQADLRAGTVTIQTGPDNTCLASDIDPVLNAVLPSDWSTWHTPPVNLDPAQGLPSCTVDPVTNTVTATVTITYTQLLWSSTVSTSATAYASTVVAPTN